MFKYEHYNYSLPCCRSLCYRHRRQTDFSSCSCALHTFTTSRWSYIIWNYLQSPKICILKVMTRIKTCLRPLVTGTLFQSLMGSVAAFEISSLLRHTLLLTWHCCNCRHQTSSTCCSSCGEGAEDGGAAARWLRLGSGPPHPACGFLCLPLSCQRHPAAHHTC